jgi:glycosyltransferase involved in cell wall biosynthesis
MKCPTLKELPPPPPSKIGWPWTEESRPQQYPASATEDNDAPKISIITPSYNQGQFIEETIRSVLLQGYANLEYLVIDGGSTDGTTEVIRKYESWLYYWVSEKDRGQSHAINKGLERISGTRWGWINSDDLLLPDTLCLLADAHRQAPQALLAGDVIDFHEDRPERVLVRQGELELRKIIEFWTRQQQWHQPGIFFPTELSKSVGPLDESLRYLFDYDFLCRLLAVASVRYLQRPVAGFRLHPESKTVSQGELFMLELCRISQRYWHMIPQPDRAGYRRHAAALLFCTGCQGLLYRRPHSWRFISEGLQTHPWWAVRSALGLLPQWLRKRWQANDAIV